MFGYWFDGFGFVLLTIGWFDGLWRYMLFVGVLLLDGIE